MLYRLCARHNLNTLQNKYLFSFLFIHFVCLCYERKLIRTNHCVELLNFAVFHSFINWVGVIIIRTECSCGYLWLFCFMAATKYCTIVRLSFGLKNTQRFKKFVCIACQLWELVCISIKMPISSTAKLNRIQNGNVNIVIGPWQQFQRKKAHQIETETHRCEEKFTSFCIVGM